MSRSREVHTADASAVVLRCDSGDQMYPFRAAAVDGVPGVTHFIIVLLLCTLLKKKNATASFPSKFYVTVCSALIKSSRTSCTSSIETKKVTETSCMSAFISTIVNSSQTDKS